MLVLACSSGATLCEASAIFEAAVVSHQKLSCKSSNFEFIFRKRTDLAWETMDICRVLRLQGLFTCLPACLPACPLKRLHRPLIPPVKSDRKRPRRISYGLVCYSTTTATLRLCYTCRYKRVMITPLPCHSPAIARWDWTTAGN